jgi:uncharacterized protein (DUF302 family)
MKQRVIFAAVWVLIGMALMGAIVWFAMPSIMLIKRPSPHSYDETIALLNQSLASKGDWRVLAVNDYQKATATFGAIDRTGSMSVCNPRYASRILADAADRGVTAFMPLAIGVYEDEHGRVYVTRLNVGMLGMMFGGTISDVMAMAGTDLNEVVASVAPE